MACDRRGREIGPEVGIDRPGKDLLDDLGRDRQARRGAAERRVHRLAISAVGVVVELDLLLSEIRPEMRQASRRMVALVRVANAHCPIVHHISAGRRLLVGGAAHGQDLAGAYRTAVLTEVDRDRARDHADMGGVHLDEHRAIGRAALNSHHGAGADGDDDPKRTFVGRNSPDDQITQLDIDWVEPRVTDGHITLRKR